MSNENPYSAPATHLDARDMKLNGTRFGCGNLVFLILGLALIVPATLVLIYRIRAVGLMGVIAQPPLVLIFAFMIAAGGLLLIHSVYRSERVVGIVAILFLVLFFGLFLTI